MFLKVFPILPPRSWTVSLILLAFSLHHYAGNETINNNIIPYTYSLANKIPHFAVISFERRWLIFEYLFKQWQKTWSCFRYFDAPAGSVSWVGSMLCGMYLMSGNVHGYPAYSHHDRFPPWWVFVRDDNGGNLSGDKIPPLMMIIINHLTQFNSSRSLVMLLPDCINTALDHFSSS